MHLSDNLIRLGARDSPLSRAQVWEVLQEIHLYCPKLRFFPLFVKTYGDKDKTSSLRGMEKTDFFTREIDEM
jgi:hydroxymethylbilane synthase